MAWEIERKFLVKKELLPELSGGRRIIQGYLCEKPSIRFRSIEGEINITVKDYYSGSKRFELETVKADTTCEEIEKLISLAVVPPIVKTRYLIPYQGLMWEIDVYEAENDGLITVDVELPEEEYSIAFPDWVEASKEITDNDKYSNFNLGKNPVSGWSRY